MTWTDQELRQVMTIVEAAIQDGENEALNIAALWMLGGAGHSVTRGLLWAQGMLSRPVSDTWGEVVTQGVAAAARELGPVWLDQSRFHDAEEWVPPSGREWS